MVLAVSWRKSLIAALVAAFFTLSGDYAAGEDYVPVAKRPRGEVLAKGANYLRPDLTRGMVNDYRDLLAWILQIQFSDEQSDQFEQRLIVRWPGLLGWDVDEITGATKLSADIRAMPPAQLKATHKQLNEQVLKNLHAMVGGAMMLENFTPVDDEDRRDAAWLLAIYQDQHPESVAPMPALPDVPGVAQPKPQPKAEPRSSADAPHGAAPAADAMSQIVCFLAAKSGGAEYLPPSEEFRDLFTRKLATEYPTYSPDQQAALEKLPAYWSQLKSNWDRMSQTDRDTTVTRWKPLLDSLQTPAGQAQDLTTDEQAAVASMSNQAAQTRQRLDQLRAMQQRDMNQQMQLRQLELRQQMQQQQITMMSNIAKSAHDTNMRIIDNMGPTRHPWD
jgi:hypothetical protein